MSGHIDREERRREITIATSRQMISRHERPLFRAWIEEAATGGYTVIDETFTTEVWVNDRGLAADAVRAQIAKLLRVSPRAFDVEVTSGR
jgi:hypothetical protein